VPGRFKPGLDWTAIRECWEAGQSARSLANRFPVTRQGIEYRAKQEEWTRTPQAEAITATGTLQRTEQPKTARDRALSVLDARRTPAAMQRILDALREGSTRRMAARLARIPESSVRDWLEVDEEFAALAKAAEAEFAAAAVKRVSDAGRRGEWRADMALLERHPATRQEFAPRTEAEPEGAGVQVQIVFTDRGLATSLLNTSTPGARIIEHVQGGETRYMLTNDPPDTRANAARAGRGASLESGDADEGSTGRPLIGGPDRG
jgi:hypothetical protein